MGKINTLLHALSVGVINRQILPRVDLTKMRLAAEEQTNILCQTTGAGFLRPGLEYCGTAAAQGRLVDFTRSATASSVLELVSGGMRIWNDGALVTRAGVSATITNGDFSSATGWITTGTNGGTATISGGRLELNATNVGGTARCRRASSTSSVGVEHGLRIVVSRGPVTFRCGGSSGSGEYIDTTLFEGEHSLAFTPTTGTFWVQFETTEAVNRLVDSVQIEGAGIVSLPTPWNLADLQNLRFAQSADVAFVACTGKQQRRIERRGARSWSVVKYYAADGPFTIDRTANVKLKPSGLNGNRILYADKDFFTEDHVGALFRLFHTGQNVSATIAAEDEYTDPIRVTGVTTGSNDRNFQYAITGTWVGEINMMRSYDGEASGYRPAGVGPWVANTSGTYGDTDDNAIIYYKLGFRAGDYTSGTATLTMNYDGGGDYGICRVTGYTSATEVNIEVLRPFANTTYTSDWREGEWSDVQGWPSAVGFFDGRLWWSGTDRVWGSISDVFDGFDEDFEGDGGPILRSIATGGVNETQWILPLQRLIFGTNGAETSARSSSFDEPITPTNLTLRDASTIGSAAVSPAKIDGRGLFVDRSRRKLFELMFEGSSLDYASSDISKLSSDLFRDGIKEIAVQRRPDTRIWVVTDEGDCICIVYEPAQEVVAFIPIETDGVFESVAVVPDEEQDRVYFIVQRTVNSATVRYVERMAYDTETRPATLTKCSDAHMVIENGSPGTVISGLTHLIGEEVVVWGDGNARGTYTVSAGGTITLTTACASVVVGLPYEGRYKSGRLSYAAQGGTAMLQPKRATQVGLIMADYHRAGVQYGPDFDTLYDLPAIERGTTPDDIEVDVVNDYTTFPLGGGWSEDARVCMKFRSPYPATCVGVVVSVTTNDKL